MSDRLTRLAPRVFLRHIDAADGRVHPPAAVPEGSMVLPQLRSPAFGDGTHPTTRLCARAVDLLCRQRAPRAVLDVGSGTGVLARIARAHGAIFVVATDVDQESLRSVTANAALDASDMPIHVHDARRHEPDAWGPRFDLVVANILVPVLVTLAPRLVAALSPHGVLLLSGLTAPEAPELRAAFSAAGAAVTVQARDGEWIVLQLRRTAEERAGLSRSEQV